MRSRRPVLGSPRAARTTTPRTPRLTLMPSHSPEAAGPLGPAAGDPSVRVFRACGRVVLMELEEDGTPGEELSIPEARATPEYLARRLAQFEQDASGRKVRTKFELLP